ncbi:amino acid--tRNA ligase-related protein [Chengkuizengella axinellae]|uniref:Amino acid--tRNA ligase-related protein n=1 Tax=Chengkuizengella axinellae TaxID=3064388 RepID=A0ABT9J6M9_9BACL|nr:amino acid--tRNA ligase-related protein [Chengkuizengella sp. 2205SS18-9]MDP5277123.1 amino acid--tRNA ligase-related protein [Chengkuizengella sp. 2205SS18-9]
MKRNFSPNVTIEQLMKKKYNNITDLYVSGRIRFCNNKVCLFDEEYEIELKGIKKEDFVEYSFVGLKGNWDSNYSCLENCVVLFYKNLEMSVHNSNIPEAQFILQTKKMTAVKRRAIMINYIQKYMNSKDFLLVQTPILRIQPEVSNIKQLETTTQNNVYFLRTDPEEYLKRYLTAGFEAVYEVSTNFRPEKPDDTHLQEFTSLECYRRFWSLNEAIHFCYDLIKYIIKEINGETCITFNEYSIDFSLPINTVDFSSIMQQHAGVNLDEYKNTEDLVQYVIGKGWWSGTGGKADKFKRTWIEWIFDNKILPNIKKPTFITGFPIELGISAKGIEKGESLRAELYLPGGFELAHLYENIIDSNELIERYSDRLKYRIANKISEVNLDEGLIESTKLGMPPLAGVAIGLDRLLQVINEDEQIGEGLLFPREGFE